MSGTTRHGALRRLMARSWAGAALLLVFQGAVLAVFSLLSPWFLDFDNLMSIGANMAFIGLMSAAQTPLIIAGGLDLSVAAVAGMSGVVVALLYADGVNVWLGSLAALVVGGVIGAINGLFTTKLKLNPLIVTLGTMSVVTGLSLVLTGGLTASLLVPGFNWIGSGRAFSLPVPWLLAVALYVVLGWVLSQTRFGRYVYASGGNPEASRLIGVPVSKTLMQLYVFSGVTGAFAGLILAAMLGAAAPDAAGPHLLTIIAAVVLGGTSLFGGRGSVWGTALAVLILGTLDNGLTLIDVSSFWQNVARGVVLLLAVSVDQIRTQALGD